MEERKRIADEEERKRKEHELKVNLMNLCYISNIILQFRLTMRLLYKHSFDHTKFVKCFVKKQRKPKKVARRKKANNLLMISISSNNFKLKLLFETCL